jgi:uncharacterized protein YegL
MGIFGNPYQNANTSNQPPQNAGGNNDYAGSGANSYGDVAGMGIEAISEQHVACVFILDTSGSMNNNGAIDKLNDGLRALKAYFDGEGSAAACVDVAIISCGPGVSVVQNFMPMTQWQPPVLTANGPTPMGQALMKAMEMVKEQKNKYKTWGTPYYRPWIVCITDGEPTDSYEPVAANFKEMENTSGVIGYCIGVEGFNEVKMASIFDKGKGRLLRLANADFKVLFEFLGNSMSALRDSGSQGKKEATVEMPRQMTFVQ